MGIMVNYGFIHSEGGVPHNNPPGLVGRNLSNAFVPMVPINCPMFVFCGSFDWHSKWAIIIYIYRKFKNVKVAVDRSSRIMKNV